MEVIFLRNFRSLSKFQGAAALAQHAIPSSNRHLKRTLFGDFFCFNLVNKNFTGRFPISFEMETDVINVLLPGAVKASLL